MLETMFILCEYSQQIMVYLEQCGYKDAKIFFDAYSYKVCKILRNIVTKGRQFHKYPGYTTKTVFSHRVTATMQNLELSNQNMETLK